MNFKISPNSLLLSGLVNKKRQLVQVVFGLRQVGKTTMIGQVLNLNYYSYCKTAHFTKPYRRLICK